MDGKKAPTQLGPRPQRQNISIAQVWRRGGGASHEHGAADKDEEVEAVLVGEQGVPDADDVGQEELLGQQQGQPTEGEVLGLDVLLLLLGRRPRNDCRWNIYE